MGNAGTDGADETRRDSEAEPPRADRRGDGREPRHATPSGDAEGGRTPEPGEAQPWGAGYSTDAAPEWPLTNENRIVETTAPTPARPAAESKPPRHATDDTTVLPAADDTTILPGFDEPRGQARIPGEADPSSGFLVAQGLSATGPEGPIFTTVSVTAELGEIVTIIGDSGTGRTALLLALSGRFKCQAGTLTIAGEQRPSRIRSSVAIAWAPPAVMFDDNHTVAAVLSESALVGDTAEAEVRRRCDELRLDLDTGTAFGRLSRLDRTLLALASAWAADAPVIAVDDLDSGVDDAGTARLWEAARVVADDRRLVLATAVRAGTAADRVLHPRPLTSTNTGGRPPR